MHAQRQQILNHLKSGKAITPLEALQLYGCLRLGARIWDLKKQGHNIKTRIIEVGNGKRVAEYSI